MIVISLMVWRFLTDSSVNSSAGVYSPAFLCLSAFIILCDFSVILLVAQVSQALLCIMPILEVSQHSGQDRFNGLLYGSRQGFIPMSVKVLSTSTETVVTTTYNIEYKGAKYTLSDYSDENGKIIETTLKDEHGDAIYDYELIDEICEEMGE